jgi:hypothetical protein
MAEVFCEPDGFLMFIDPSDLKKRPSPVLKGALALKQRESPLCLCVLLWRGGILAPIYRSVGSLFVQFTWTAHWVG